MIGKVTLVGGNKCPVCGKEFFATPPLRPNIEDREFYGGRVKFFKKVTCDCLGEYDLCIEKKFNPVKVEEEFNVINMILLKEGLPLEKVEEIKLDEKKQAELELEAKTRQEVARMTEETGKMPLLSQRLEVKKQNVLATVVDLNTKIETLSLRTKQELQNMCKKRKIKFSVNWSKADYARALLAHNPDLVVANPDD